jgi:hypothetical protein
MADQGVVSAEPRPAARGVPGPLGWAAAFVVLAAVVAVTAEAGAWFVPFIVGVAAGVASLRWRRMVVLAVFAAVVGWAIPMWLLVLRGLPARRPGPSRAWPASRRTRGSPSWQRCCSPRCRP